MSIEKKSLYVGDLEREKSEVALRQEFGWTFVGDHSPGRSGLHADFERDKDMPNYARLAELEKEFDNAQASRKYYSPIYDNPEMFLLILIFIFPFVLYCIYKSNQKQEYAEINKQCEARKKAALDAARQIPKKKTIVIFDE